jgi:hypothetical protein
MGRFFAAEGPIIPGDHYHIDPLTRIDFSVISRLIQQKKYFVLHAPRQTGKTSYLFALMKAVNTEGKYQSLYINVEPAQAARENVKAGMRTILNILANITGGSAFNIKAKSLRLDNFDPDEIKILYHQHTEETGQKFSKEIFPLAWELTYIENSLRQPGNNY